MDNEINNKETMATTETKKTTKKKVTSKKDGHQPKDVTIHKFKDIEGKFLLVKVGTDQRPATSEDIEDVQSRLVTLLENNNVNCLAFVTHHAVEVSIVEQIK